MASLRGRARVYNPGSSTWQDVFQKTEPGSLCARRRRARCARARLSKNGTAHRVAFDRIQRVARGISRTLARGRARFCDRDLVRLFRSRRAANGFLGRRTRDLVEMPCLKSSMYRGARAARSSLMPLKGASMMGSASAAMATTRPALGATVLRTAKLDLPTTGAPVKEAFFAETRAAGRTAAPRPRVFMVMAACILPIFFLSEVRRAVLWCEFPPTRACKGLQD